MGNPFFGAFGGGGMMQMVSQLRSDPLGFLRRAGFQVPDNVTDPQAIIQHLMNSGQVNQAQVNQAQQMAQGFGLK